MKLYSKHILDLHNSIAFLMLLFVIIITSFISCTSSVIKKETTQEYSFTAQSTTLTKSKDRIDNTATYEAYFELADNTRCIEISVIAIDQYNKRVRCGYILESEVDTSRFPKKPLQPVFTEIAKNFDVNWRFQSNIVFCSDQTDPLKRLNKGNYRLKITAFSDKMFTFTIQIKSSVPVAFKK